MKPIGRARFAEQRRCCMMSTHAFNLELTPAIDAVHRRRRQGSGQLALPQVPKGRENVSTAAPSKSHDQPFPRCIFEKHRRGRKQGTKSVHL